jgi:hypothetical protein
VTACREKFNDVSEEYTASIFRVEEKSKQVPSRKDVAEGASICLLRPVEKCLGLLFDPEDGRDTFLRNGGANVPDYTASHPKRW